MGMGRWAGIKPPRPGSPILNKLEVCWNGLVDWPSDWKQICQQCVGTSPRKDEIREFVPAGELYLESSVNSRRTIQRTGGLRTAGGSNLFLPLPKIVTEPLRASTFPSHRRGWQKSHPDKDPHKGAVDHLPVSHHGRHWQVTYAKIAMVDHLL